MREWLLQLDDLLRGEATSERQLSAGLLNVSARRLAIIIVVLAMIYGLCMGSFSLLKEVPPDLQERATADRFLQLFATMVKVPALFFLTLIVTFPSLYVFNALVGSRLRLLNILRLLIASLAVNVTVLASMGLIVAFFSLSTKSYPFVVLLNVFVFSVSGVLGSMFLLQTMHRLTTHFASVHKRPVDALRVDEEEEGEVSDELIDQALAPDAENEPDQPFLSALDMPEGQVFAQHTRVVFRCWVVLFAVVGAQMGWVLRPFIGTPYEPFEFFRERHSNFFAAVLGALYRLLTGGG
jgi:hypothetical protein